MDRRLPCATLALALALLWSGPVRAMGDSAKGAARELANEAKLDFDAGKFEEAGLKFQKAFEIAKVPTLAVWAARALVKRGKLVAASELYHQATLLAPNDLWVGNTQQEAEADAEKELAELQPRIAKLRIRVEGAAVDDIELSIDDAQIASALLGIAIPTDPGQRRIVAKRGTEVVGRTIDLAEGERKETVLHFSQVAPSAAPIAKAEAVPPAPPLIVQKETLPPPVAAAPSTSPAAPVVAEVRNEDSSTGKAQRTWGWIAVDVGLVGLVAGAATAIVLISDKGLRSSCPNDTCDPSKVDGGSMNTYNLLRNVSLAGLIAGGVSTAVGVTLLLWPPSEASEPSVALWLGPNSAGFKGSF
jgi:hypothetical protein